MRQDGHTHTHARTLAHTQAFLTIYTPIYTRTEVHTPTVSQILSIHTACNYTHNSFYLHNLLVSTQKQLCRFVNTTHHAVQGTQDEEHHTFIKITTHTHTLVLLSYSSLMFCFHCPSPTHTFKYVHTLLSECLNPYRHTQTHHGQMCTYRKR